MRLALSLTLLLAACGSDKPPPPRPELIDAVRSLADSACECGTDKECLRAVRVELDAQKADLKKNGLVGEDKATFDAELLRLRSCGDAGGVTMWW